MHSVLVLTLLLPMGLCLALAVPVLVQIFQKSSVEEITPEWLDAFSASSYYSMERLLSDEDFTFLSRQPGFDLSLYRKLRRERLGIFKQYLNRSIVDFNRLHTAIRVLLAHSEEDCSDLVSRLVWLKFRFSCTVLRAEFSYRLCLLGFRPMAVRALISHLEEMSSHLSAIAAAQAA